MTRAEELVLIKDIAMIKEHIVAVNGDVARNRAFREAHATVCEKVRSELWIAIWRNRIALVMAALGAGAAGSAGGVTLVTKLLGLW